MKHLPFLKRTEFRPALVLVVTLIALALALGPLSVAQASDPTPQTIHAWKSYLVFTGVLTQATTTSTPVSMVLYGVADCYLTTDVASATSITPLLQSSADNVNWVTDWGYAAITTDSTVFTRTTIYGLYQRLNIPLGVVTPVTVTLRCIAKDNG